MIREGSVRLFERILRSLPVGLLLSLSDLLRPKLLHVRLQPFGLYCRLVVALLQSFEGRFRSGDYAEGEVDIFTSHPHPERGWVICTPTVLYTFDMCTVQ